MILKGNQRRRGADLAAHLLNACDNEHIDLAEIRGTVSRDLAGAFAEYEALAAGTRCREPLYSLSINPPAPLTRAQYAAAIDLIEQRLGLGRQPRALVYHVKQGREHCHVVWCRIDTIRMRAIQMSHDRQKLRAAARDLARQFGLGVPQGVAGDRGGKRFDTHDMTFGEKAAADATGIAAAQRRAEITQAWRRADTGPAFRAGLGDVGYTLARGDRRGFVVVDRYGLVHSLSRQIEGARAGDIRARLAPLTPEDLPTVEQVRNALEQLREAEQHRLPAPVAREVQTRIDALTRQQADRRRALESEIQSAKVRHWAERLTLRAAHKAEADAIAAGRSRPRGWRALFGKVPGIRAIVAFYRGRQDLKRAERQALEHAAMRRRHENENLVLERRVAALARLERREARSLETALTRLRRVAERQSEERVRDRLRQIKTNGRDITRDRKTALKENVRDITGGGSAQTPLPASRAQGGTTPPASRFQQRVADKLHQIGTNGRDITGGGSAEGHTRAARTRRRKMAPGFRFER